jgi:hypothetical protein
MTPRDQSDPPVTAHARRSIDQQGIDPEGTGHDGTDEHDRAQEVLSAAADGEQLDEIALRSAMRHADSCPECSAFRAALTHVVPVARPAAPRQTVFVAPPTALRVALWCFAAVNVIAGIPLLLRIDDVGMSGADPSHLTRDGALAVVLGVVAGVVAHQPRRARALSLVVLAIIALNVLGGSADVARGTVTAGFESIHVVNGITAALVLACAWVTKPVVRT